MRSKRIQEMTRLRDEKADPTSCLYVEAHSVTGLIMSDENVTTFERMMTSCNVVEEWKPSVEEMAY